MYRIYPFLIPLLAVVAVDQLAKWLVRETIWHMQSSIIVIPGLLQFVPVENHGVAFGLFRDYGLWLALLVAGLLIVLAAKNLGEFLAAPLSVRILAGLIAGGAAGNLIDRAHYGYVVDFITIPLLPIFQVFNIADACITVGGVFLALLLWRGNLTARQTMKPAQ